MVFCNCKQDGTIIFRLKTGRILKQILKQFDWRKIMKKALALILALCMVMALCACGQSAAPAATEAPAAADVPAADAPAETESQSFILYAKLGFTSIAVRSEFRAW